MLAAAPRPLEQRLFDQNQDQAEGNLAGWDGMEVGQWCGHSFHSSCMDLWAKESSTLVSIDSLVIGASYSNASSGAGEWAPSVVSR
jgi:hypothetical protein